ncbi:MAG: cytochrome ubiquinol oxidase subunit I [Elusimicrobia bacterium]|nr:cytochrome ubiquinol oxidase subunit I [Elusimicrobiota bacterium]
MSDLFAARAQMAVSLYFHILFACAGIALPLLMVLAEGRWLRRGDAAALELARRWSRGAAALFAVGAVSGTVLSFELGLLWPAFMAFAGPIIGMPFSLEGFAFFLEAICLGVYIYGWERVPPLAHWLCGVGVWLAGTTSGVFVVCANAWMNAPEGFVMEAGRLARVRPFAAMWNAASAEQTLHMTLAAFAAVGFAVAGIHAFMLLRRPGAAFHRVALAIALWVGGAAALLQPLSGDFSAVDVARRQPLKLAAMEGQWNTQARAPLRVGGWPDEKAEATRWALEIPGALSLLAYGSLDAEVEGLKAAAPADRPPAAAVHLAFQLMVACGLAMAALALLAAFLAWRRRGLPDQPWFLKLVALCAPLGFLALQAGWTVTELGRQPWIIYEFMRVSEAVTPMPGLWATFAAVCAIYIFLSVVVLVVLRRDVLGAPEAHA